MFLKKIWFLYFVNFWMKFKLLTLKKSINVGSKVKFRGFPILEIFPKSKLIIGDNVLINSWNTGYHLSMFMPVKLLLHSNDAILKIGDNTRIHGSCLHVKYHIAIGKNCLIAANTQIFDCNGHLNSMSNPELRLEKKDMPKKIVIEDNVWIGTGCIILPGTHIGRGTIISAGSVVSGTIPEKSIAKGNPAVVLKKS